MMAKQQIKDRAQSLRQGGKSIGEIARLLGVSKSTASYWCKNIVLTTGQLRTLAERQQRGGMFGRLRASEQKRAQRIKNTALAMEQGRQDVIPLNERDLFMLGLALYWGEGYKNGNDECGLTNSDPAIIATFIRWLSKIYGIKGSDLILRVSLNVAHKPRASIVERYWADVTHIPLSQFTSTSFIKTKMRKKYMNADRHFGTLRVKVRRGTSLRRRIMGSIDAIKKGPLVQ